MRSVCCVVRVTALPPVALVSFLPACSGAALSWPSMRRGEPRDPTPPAGGGGGPRALTQPAGAKMSNNATHAAPTPAAAAAAASSSPPTSAAAAAAATAVASSPSAASASAQLIQAPQAAQPAYASAAAAERAQHERDRPAEADQDASNAHSSSSSSHSGAQSTQQQPAVSSSRVSTLHSNLTSACTLASLRSFRIESRLLRSPTWLQTGARSEPTHIFNLHRLCVCAGKEKEGCTESRAATTSVADASLRTTDQR